MASTTSSSSASNSLQSVAARFQERAAQLAREQGLLEQTQKTWNDLKTKEQEQNRQRANLRREFLQARQERDAAEEETLALREKAIILRGEIQEYQQDMEKFQNEMQQEQQDFQSQKEETVKNELDLIESFDEKKLFKCKNCDKSYRSKENLNLHYLNVHLNTKPYSCKICDKKL